MNRHFIVQLILLTISVAGWSQKTCTSNPTTISSNINFGSITWTASGGATVAECNNMADGLITFIGNVIVDVANNKIITISNSVNITGNFPISGGPGSTLSVTGGSTLYVTGDLGDAANNGVQYNVASATDAIIVDGTLYGKNNNAFTGSGSISGGTLDVKNGSTCGTPCPVSGGFSSCVSGDPFCTTYTVLPIKLAYFLASVIDGRVHLNWATDKEENFDYFEIERANNNLSFSNIGEVQGAGYSTNTLQKYSWIDNNPIIGNNYYRLKAVDLDGSYEYFNVVLVSTTEKKRNFTVFPNPSNGESLKYRINFDYSSGDEIVILDNMGNLLNSLSISSTEDDLKLSETLKPGIYFLKYTSNAFHQTVKVIVH